MSPAGPDVSFELLQVDPTKLPVVVSGQFFDANQLTMFYCPALSWSDCNATSGIVKSKVIDNTIGPVFNLEVIRTRSTQRDFLPGSVLGRPPRPLLTAGVDHSKRCD